MSWASQFFAATIGTWASKTSIEGAVSDMTGAPYKFGNPPAPIMFLAVAAGLTAAVSFVDGGAGSAGATTGYTVLAYKAGALDATVIDSNAGTLSLTHTMTGLVGGSSYTFTAVANNIAGASAQSAQSNVIVASATTTIPSIAVPTVIGTPVTYTTPDTVTAQQWSLDGADASGATAATYTQAFADSNKALRVRDTTANGSATSLPVLAGVQNLNMRNTVSLRAMLASHDGIIFGVGDSAMAGYLSGTTAENDARANSYMARMAAKLTTAGFPASKDSAFGGSQQTTAAGYVGYDPRWAFTGGTTVLADTVARTFGGSTIQLTNTGDTAVFAPGTAFDTVDVYTLQDTTAGAATLTVDASATVLATLQRAAASKIYKMTTVSVPAGSTSVKFTSTNGTSFIQGIVTRVAASPKIQLYDGGRSGETVARLFSTPDASAALSAYVARQALTVIAGQGKQTILLLNGWYNDWSLNQSSMTPAIVTANYKLICDQAVALGITDIWFQGYADLSAGGIALATYNSYQDAIISLLRDTYNAVIFVEKNIFTSYATYSAAYYGDTLHLNGAGHDKVADTFTALCKLAAAGTIAA